MAMLFDKPRMIGQLLAESFRRTARFFHPSRLWSQFRRNVPDKLVLVPQDLRTADPVLAQEYYNGHFAFAGKRIDTKGNNPFSEEIANRVDDIEWLGELHSFRWLRHLHASTDATSNSQAQSLIRDWIANHGKPANTLAWEPQIAAQRLTAWLCHSTIIVEQSDIKSYKQFMRQIGEHISYLQSQNTLDERELGQLQVNISLAYASLCVKIIGQAKQAQSKTPREALGKLLTHQIFADGGHVSRCSSLLPEILTDLLPLQQAYDSAGIAAPPELQIAIDRIMPAIRYYRHRDGSFARFNGVGASEQDMIATVLRYDNAMGEPSLEASQSGYHRMNAGLTTVIIDAGTPPRGENSSIAHAGCLSFEMSSLRTCFVVNCGAPKPGSSKLRMASRSTAAHSTAIIHNTSSCKFHHTDTFKHYLGGRILSGPGRVNCERNKIKGFTQLSTRHDGYLREFGVWHERIIQLSDDGNALLGRDKFYGKGGNPPLHLTKDDCAIRFHLHPSVKPEIDLKNGAIDIIASENQIWRFTCDNGKVAVEESVFFAVSGGSVTTTQIVVYLELSKTHTCNWQLEQTIGTRLQ